MKKRLISLIMVAALGFSSLSVQATTGVLPDQVESCEHHQTHTSDCGYRQAVEASACTHLHEDECTLEGGDCQHTHDDGCGYAEAVEEAPCTFVCSECIKTEDEIEGQQQSQEPSLAEGDPAVEDESEEQPGAPEDEPEVQPGASENEPEVQPGASENEPEVQPGASEDEPEEQPGASENESEGQPTVSQNEVEGQPTVSQNEIEGQPTVSQNETTAPEAEDCTCLIRCKEEAIAKDCIFCASEGADIEKCKGMEKTYGRSVTRALTTMDTVYVSSSGVDGASGTQEYPVKTMEAALDLVNNGGTIQILNSASTQQLSTNEPLRITKNITIKGGTLSLSPAGIVLGADVTFEEIGLSFANAVRNAIIANGHALTLNGVRDEGTYPIHLFCGDMKDYNSAGTLPASGGNGSITITGSNNLRGDIFAGSLHVNTTAGVWTGNSTITLSPGVSGFTGKVYAHGATEPTGTGNQGMTPDSSLYTATGTVTIDLTNGINQTIDGKTGGSSDAAITFTDNGNGYTYSPTFNNIGSLTINAGGKTSVLQPSATSSFSAGAAITVPSGTRLDLTKLGNISIGSLSGGGVLVLNANQTLEITGNISGTTQIGIGSIAFDGTSQNTATDGHTYVVAPNSGDDSFSLLDSYYDGAQPITKGSDGSWTAGTTAGDVDVVTISGFTLGNVSISEGAALGQLPVTVSYSKDTAAPDEFLYSYFDQISVLVNSVEAPYKDDEYAYVDDVSGLNLYFSPDGDYLNIEHRDGTLSEGEYTISVRVAESATTNNTAITSSGKLTVTGSGSTTTHSHNFTYQASGGTITATCRNTDGGCPQVSQSITLSAPGGNLEYDGSAKTATLSGSIEGQNTPQITYQGTNYAASTNPPVNAGSYTASITVGGQSAQVAFTITPKNISQAGATVGSFDPLTYTGSPQIPRATVTVGGASVEGTWSAVTNVGEQSTFTATGNYTGTLLTDVGMAKADPVVTAPVAMTNLTYTGQSQTLVQAGTTTAGTLQYQINGGAWNTTLPTGVQAGSYTIAYRVEGDNNYNSKEGFATISVTISRVAQTVLNITGQPANPTYGDSFTLSASGGSGTGSVTWAVTAGNAYAQVDANTGVVRVIGTGGTVTVTATKAGDNNYQETSQSWTFTPAKKKVSATVSATNKTYDGTMTATITAQVAADQLIVGDSLTIESVRGNFTDANVGSAKVVTIDSGAASWKGTNASHYEVSFPASTTAEITKATTALTNGSLNVTNGHAGNYTYDLEQLLPALTGGQNYGTVVYRLDGITLPNYYISGAAVDKNTLTLPILEVPSDKEETIGTITVSVESQNYNFTGNATISVKSSNKEVVQGSPLLSTDTLVYGDMLSKVTLSGSMRTVDGTDVEGTFAWDTPDVRLEAGVRQVKWTFTPTDTAKYLIISGISDITVKPAAGQASVTMAGWVFGQTANNPVANTTTNSNVTVIFSYKKKGEPDSSYTGNKPQAAGTYVVRAVFPANNNYTEAVATAEFTIQGMNQSAPGVVVEQSKTYNSVTLKTIEASSTTGAKAEYSKDGGVTWQSSPVFTGLSASTAYRFTARYEAIGNYAASPYGPITEITTSAQPASGSSSGSGGGGGNTGAGTGSGTNASTTSKPAKTEAAVSTAATNTITAAAPAQIRTVTPSSQTASQASNDQGSLESKSTLQAGEKNMDLSVEIVDGIALLSVEEEALAELIEGVGEEGVILDLSQQKGDVQGVDIPLTVLTAVVGDQAETSLTLYLPTGAIRLDGTALQSIHRQAESDSLQIVVENVGTKSLNSKQKDAVSSLDVQEGVEVYIYCRASNKRIGDFEGGMAEVWIPFVIPQDSEAGDFGIYHVSETGEMERLNTRYENVRGVKEGGYLVGDTSHFSDFVVIHEKVEEAEVPAVQQQETQAPEEVQPERTEGNHAGISVMVVAVILLILLAGVGIYLAKKKKA